MIKWIKETLKKRKEVQAKNDAMRQFESTVRRITESKQQSPGIEHVGLGIVSAFCTIEHADTWTTTITLDDSIVVRCDRLFTGSLVRIIVDEMVICTFVDQTAQYDGSIGTGDYSIYNHEICMNAVHTFNAVMKEN